MAAAATSVYVAGVVIVGAAGQTMRTTAGMLSGWINSTLIVSSDALMVPLAKGVMGCLGKADSYSV
jgi:hypothetical protein